MQKELKLVAKTEEFTNEKGEKIPYISYKTEINGKTFSLFPKEADKKLMQYMLTENRTTSDSADDDEI